MFYSRLEAKQVLLDLMRQIESEESRGGEHSEESARDYLKAVLNDEGNED